VAPTAVIFDVGGVVVDSPLHVIADYERRQHIPPDAINRVVVETGPQGAWSRLERGELRLPEFHVAFEADCRAAGIEIDAAARMGAIAAAGRPRPIMRGASACLRAHDLRVAALTNNWIAEDAGLDGLRVHFDVVVESAVVGLRKPDPRIYHLVCDELGVAPGDAVFLDDIGRNLKAARELGMTTIKVVEAETALRELGTVVGLTLV
jgi:epoxide hydrolase-like predicted phosphatase